MSKKHKTNKKNYDDKKSKDNHDNGDNYSNNYSNDALTQISKFMGNIDINKLRQVMTVFNMINSLNASYENKEDELYDENNLNDVVPVRFDEEDKTQEEDKNDIINLIKAIQNLVDEDKKKMLEEVIQIYLMQKNKDV